MIDMVQANQTNLDKLQRCVDFASSDGVTLLLTVKAR
jgi:hypothetical protein